MARPTKYTPERTAKILEALEAGTSRRGAAEFAGIDEKTLITWMRRYSSFSSAVKEAEAGVEVRASRAINTAFADGDWRAALSWLERRRHADWGKVDRVELEVKRVAATIAASTGADPDWLIKRAAEIVATAEIAEGVD